MTLFSLYEEGASFEVNNMISLRELDEYSAAGRSMYWPQGKSRKRYMIFTLKWLLHWSSTPLRYYICLAPLARADKKSYMYKGRIYRSLYGRETPLSARHYYYARQRLLIILGDAQLGSLPSLISQWWDGTPPASRIYIHDADSRCGKLSWFALLRALEYISARTSPSHRGDI